MSTSAETEANEKGKELRLKEYMSSQNLSNKDREDILRRNPPYPIAIQKVNKIVANRRRIQNYIKEKGLEGNITVDLPSKFTDAKNILNDILKTKINNKKFQLENKLRNIKGLNASNIKKFINRTNSTNENIIAEAQRLANNKLKEQKNKNKQELKKYLNNLGMNNDNKKKFMNDDRNLDIIKSSAEKYMKNVMNKKRQNARKNLVEYLNSDEMQNLHRNDRIGILKRFDDTMTNVKKLKNNAKRRANARRQERFAQSESEFLKYLNTLTNLTAKNKINITSQMKNSINIELLKKSATNTAIKRAREKREANRAKFLNYLKEKKLPNIQQNRILKRFNNGKNSLENIKKNVNSYKNKLTNYKKSELKNKLKNYILTPNNRKILSNKINANPYNNIMKEANTLQKKFINNQKNELKSLIEQANINGTKILENFNTNPSNFEKLKSEIEKARLSKKEEKLKIYLSSLNELSSDERQEFLKRENKNGANRLQANRKQKRITIQQYISSLNLPDDEKLKLTNMKSLNLNQIKEKANSLLLKKKLMNERRITANELKEKKSF